jgi:NADH:ubiquinone reductase (H+-translocating)
MNKPRVVVIGGGFGGLSAVKALHNASVDIILIDKTNHHLFQPLLYQVATAALSPGDIAVPIREILRNQDNVKIILGEVTDIDREKLIVKIGNQVIHFDYLIVATGSRHSYFQNPEWEKYAPGLKTIPDALLLREKTLLSFEKAEAYLIENRELAKEKINLQKYLTFVIVGGGPTGVELAGAIAEISRKTMLKDFRMIDPSETRIILVEYLPRILPTFHPSLSEAAKRFLESMGVTVLVNRKVTGVYEHGVKIDEEYFETQNIIWAAGNTAMPLLKTLNTETDKNGRVIVEPDLSIKQNHNIFVIGDACYLVGKDNKPLPGVAPVAIQEGKYVASIIKHNKRKEERKSFNYFDKGNLATIGRAKAIAEIGKIKLRGYVAWLTWSFIHILYLIGFRNRYRVMIEWIWLYFTRRNGIRLITNKTSEFPGEV